MENYNKTDLEKLGIYELRSYARKIGVKSPTTKRHGELINCILKILTGQDKAISTTKGRPPKKVSFASNGYISELSDNSPFKYCHDSPDDVRICDGERIESLNKVFCKCGGVYREVDGKYYVYNHSSHIKFVTVPQELIEQYNINIGDYIEGEAYELNSRTGVLEKIDDVNFSRVNAHCDHGKNKKKFSLCEIDDVYAIYNKIKEQKDKPIKIVVELEVDDFSIVNLKDDCIYFYSKELDDIKRSFNVLLDCLVLVQKLSQENKPFTLYLIDIDYIFSVINAYLKFAQCRDSVDAVQFIKTIFAYVKSSTGGNAVIYENKKYNRNDYLDAILTKYI